MCHHIRIATQRGFSMLEILVALVIIAIALLGTAGLQVYALRVNQSGQFRTQAVFLASDISERMEANKAAAVAGNYVQTLTGTPSVAGSDCALITCSPADLALWDISQWGVAIDGLLPQASWEITQTTAGNPSIYQIIIHWSDRSSNKASRSEAFSYTATRTVYD